ncbi:hypothetical protein BCR44DRAFT_1427688 [Catenaria anguillulae PL171]|uniref:Nuclear cap-binding protein subunit 2 n=1 Tax=Catenaria anguillulae PL171 TaxID=765915 RepID=A0A1Y2HXP7_9FUNG|nr:hypothetical protein BCR44DRAFT_1427688 [Catenaria anguillulae PL171]
MSLPMSILPRASQLGDANIVIADQAKPSDYVDRNFPGTTDEWYTALSRSSTVYVGNLSFHTTEEQIHELFSKCGQIKRIIMGLDKHRYTPCGFCFVEYYTHDSALDCLRYISNTKLDDRFVRVDLDPGFRDGRQFGRGRHGGQVRDEHRTDFDAGRGGWGPSVVEAPPARQEQSYAAQYQVTPGANKRRRDGAEEFADDRNAKLGRRF